MEEIIKEGEEMQKTVLRSDLGFIQRGLDGLCRRASDVWHKAQDTGWDGSTELAGLTGALEGLADIVKDIREEEEC